MRYLLLFFFSFLFFASWGQMSDSFDDGDFTNNPKWVGDVDSFIVNTNNELQLNANGGGSGECYLSTPHNLTQLEDIEWRFKIKYDFNPSATNVGETYLTATDADLSIDPDGIFLRIGENGNKDPIYLIERLNGNETILLSSSEGIVA